MPLFMCFKYLNIYDHSTFKITDHKVSVKNVLLIIQIVLYGRQSILFLIILFCTKPI